MMLHHAHFFYIHTSNFLDLECYSNGYIAALNFSKYLYKKLFKIIDIKATKRDVSG